MHLSRFQFRLRTLLLLVTLLGMPCAYVGWQAKIVAQRKAWLKAKAANNPELFPLSSLGEGDPAKGPSLIRRLLGDTLQEEVIVPDSADAESVAALFPEADIFTYTILRSGMSDMDPKHPQGFGGGGTF